MAGAGVMAGAGRSRLLRATLCVVVSAVAAVAFAPVYWPVGAGPGHHDTSARGAAISAVGDAGTELSLGLAEQRAVRRQPAPARLQVGAVLTLGARHRAVLADVLARGGRLSPRQWDAAYGPTPAAVAQVRRALERSGISSYWSPGQVELRASGPASAVDRLFHVRVDTFALADGVRFYAALGRPFVPPDLAPTVREVTGLDDYAGYLPPAIVSNNGVTPSQMSSFYDLSPLRRAGFNGRGVTVMFPEDAVPDPASLREYAQIFGLPPFHLRIITNPSWGGTIERSDPEYWNYIQEATMDVEIVHGLAPGAREIVYEGASSFAPAMFQAMTTAHPGAIMSGSYYGNECEQEPGAESNVKAWDAVFTQAAAEGTSIFWASGDRGAYACLSSPYSSLANEGQLSLAPDGTSPHTTSVGGTTVFLAANGAYYKEMAWGEPMEQWGGGGGYSAYFPRPAWQQGPGTEGTQRGVPDVAADADPNSGWACVLPVQGESGPQKSASGGTSASTPAWAGMTALIDQYLESQHLATVGFANPALYYFGSSPKGLPAPAFHQVTVGTNLYYQATAGWNPATGLGTPDVAHLADDFAWYDRTHR